MSEGRLLAWLNIVAAGQDTASQGHSVSCAAHLVLEWVCWCWSGPWNAPDLVICTANEQQLI